MGKMYLPKLFTGGSIPFDPSTTKYCFDDRACDDGASSNQISYFFVMILMTLSLVFFMTRFWLTGNATIKHVVVNFFESRYEKKVLGPVRQKKTDWPTHLPSLVREFAFCLWTAEFQETQIEFSRCAGLSSLTAYAPNHFFKARQIFPFHP